MRIRRNTSAPLSKPQEFSNVASSSSMLSSLRWHEGNRLNRHSKRSKRNGEELKLRNQVATLRRDVATMRSSLDHVHTIISKHIQSLSPRKNVPIQKVALASQPNLSHDAEETVFDLRGILVNISSTFSSSLEEEDDCASSTSTVSSLGFDGHHELSAMSKSLGIGKYQSPTKSKSCVYQQSYFMEEEEHASFVSLSIWEEHQQKGRLLALLVWERTTWLFSFCPSSKDSRPATRRCNHNLPLYYSAALMSLILLLVASSTNHHNWFSLSSNQTTPSCAAPPLFSFDTAIAEQARNHFVHFSTNIISNTTAPFDENWDQDEAATDSHGRMPATVGDAENSETQSPTPLSDSPLHPRSITTRKNIVESFRWHRQRLVQKLRSTNKGI